MTASTRYYRKVLRISALDSPNVARGLAAQRGDDPSTWPDELPGLLTYPEYVKRRATWSEVRQTIGLDAMFYEGAELLLFPAAWLANAARLALDRPSKRQAKAIGCDPGEGGANTCWCVVDEWGILEMVSLKTPDTTVIPSMSLALIRKHSIPPDRFVFDRGGGGKQAADHMRLAGVAVRTVAFGESPSLPVKRGIHQIEARRELVEDRYVYVNLRAQMYHEASLLLDTARTDGSFAIPAIYTELTRQLAVMPKLTDGEGRYWMMPKTKRDSNDKRPTLTELIGHSPDECLIAGTLVMTDGGEVPIERIQVGMRVLTRQGFRRVLSARLTNPVAATTEVIFSDGRSLCGTANHPVFIEEKGFVPIDALVLTDKIVSCQTSSLSTVSSSLATRTPEAFPRNDTTTQASICASKALAPCIRKSGRSRTDRSPLATSSTIEMITTSTTTFPTLFVSRPASIPLNTLALLLLAGQRQQGQDLSQKRGMPAQKEGHGTASMASNAGLDAEQNRGRASSVARTMKHRLCTEETGFAPVPADSDGITRIRPSTLSRHAKSAARSICVPLARNRHAVPVHVVRVSATGRDEPVYNLAVEGCQEYFANGVLVHNSDAFVLACHGLLHKSRKVTAGAG